MTKISEEERKRRKNEARKLLYASDPEYAKRKREKSTTYRLEQPEKVKQCAANHYLQNKVKINAKRSADYAKNPEPYKAKSIAYGKEHKQEVKLFNFEYQAKNALKIKAQKAGKYLKDRNKVLAKCAENYAKNPAPAKARSKAWAKENPERVRVRSINRRAWKKTGVGRLSKDLVIRLLALQKDKCTCCRVDLKVSGYHLDHIEPLSKGGPHEDANIQLLCPPCNMAKHTKHPIDFMQSRGFLL